MHNSNSFPVIFKNKIKEPTFIPQLIYTSTNLIYRAKLLFLQIYFIMITIFLFYFHYINLSAITSTDMKLISTKEIKRGQSVATFLVVLKLCSRDDSTSFTLEISCEVVNNAKFHNIQIILV